MVDYESEFMRRADSPLELFRDSLNGESVVCLGAGASLREQDPALLACSSVFACNSSWRWLKRSSPRCIHVGIVITDSRRLREEAPLIVKEMSEPIQPVVFCSPSNYPLEKVSTDWADAARSIPTLVPMRGGGPSSDIFDPTVNGLNSMGGSVIFHAITLAAFMGAERIYLVGCDFDYNQHPAWWHDTEQVPKWLGLGDFEVRALEAMRMYAREYKKRGIELINATRGGKIDCLPRVNYEETFK